LTSSVAWQWKKFNTNPSPPVYGSARVTIPYVYKAAKFRIILNSGKRKVAKTLYPFMVRFQSPALIRSQMPLLVSIPLPDVTRQELLKWHGLDLDGDQTSHAQFKLSQSVREAFNVRQYTSAQTNHLGEEIAVENKALNFSISDSVSGVKFGLGR
jgi:hypothetical protein